MSWTKIGATLHIKFSKYNVNLDVDLNPPNFRTRNIDDYNGSNRKKRKYLEENRATLVGWLEEWKKSLNTRGANTFPESKRSIRRTSVSRNWKYSYQVYYDGKNTHISPLHIE